METLTANWPICVALLSVMVAPLSRISIYVIVSCIATLLVDQLLWGITNAAEWHTYALIKVGLLSVFAASISTSSRWWLLIIASLSIDFVVNIQTLYAELFTVPAVFANMYLLTTICTSTLEGVAAHGGNRGRIDVRLLSGFSRRAG